MKLSDQEYLWHLALDISIRIVIKDKDVTCVPHSVFFQFPKLNDPKRMSEMLYSRKTYHIEACLKLGGLITIYRRYTS
ncbi:hypothetical protein O6P43_020076 [Quillaja saponaria]|uniref:Uncharacterized protein n=1 Tax=Quillaja saponaria TaxID=32244 RepID=A0AAD7LJV9_QUISA|nr:hypothetical protein O6P43_020076 [Quillaja saponaria]